MSSTGALIGTHNYAIKEVQSPRARKHGLRSSNLGADA